eukprot:TRINITY_DN61241_c0_g1_i1.p1 TRINITY_DN61241_c0_g1~~TRINITY_DN61241_c0_g1_i1.p1  ORF type:complete len:251 (-),score=140.28 TRINITY_DN61241_c0_g1_i1:74-826(-)
MSSSQDKETSSEQTASPATSAAASGSAAAAPQQQQQEEEKVPYVDPEFAKQFDRNNPEWHNSQRSDEAVVLGGAKIPKGMEAHANWQDLPEVAPAPPQDFGPEYNRIKAVREDFNAVKKAISKMMPLIANVVRLVPVKDKKPKTWAKALRLRDEALAKVVALQPKFDDQAEYKEALQEVIEGAKRAEEYNANTHQTYKEKTTRFTQLIFRVQREMMQDMKKAKQAYLAAQKEDKDASSAGADKTDDASSQ